MRDYEPYYTEDGSIGLYSFADKDVYHSKFGALTEAWEKFILPSGLDKNNNSEIKVLDVCYGIGYNSKALMSFFINKNNIAIAGIIGLIIVDGDILVLNVFLNTKLAISNIGHSIINTHIIFSSFILCFMSCFFLPTLLFFLYCKYFRIYFICNFIY